MLTTLDYEADLLGSISQALAGLQGYDVMALELIQNADDAKAKTLCFDVTDNALFVRNSASFSNCGLKEKRCPWEKAGNPDGLQRSCNFHAISRMGSRNKVQVASQIGRFGIGFASVYQITDTPIIRSSGTEIALSPIEGAGNVRAVADEVGSEFELGWASTETETRQALKASPTPANIVQLVAEAINSVLARATLFLRHLETISLYQHGVLVSSVEINRDKNDLRLEFKPSLRVERWKLLSRDAGDLADQRGIFNDYPILTELDRLSLVTIALPLDDTPVDGLIYAFLPTEQSSRLPAHINADFFPHPDRRKITLSGKQHDATWNKLLIDTAARVIAENFEELLKTIGAERLWAIVSASYDLRDTECFRSFWTDIQTVAKNSISVHTVDDKWCSPVECFRSNLKPASQSALASINMMLLHERLHPYWTVLKELGARDLCLPAVLTALKKQQLSEGYSADMPHLRALWIAVDAVLEQSTKQTDFKSLTEELKTIQFTLNSDEELASMKDLWRTEKSVSPSLVKRYIHDCPIAHEDLLKLSQIKNLINIYHFDDFAQDIKYKVPDEEAAKILIGAEPSDAREFYEFLTSFAVDPSASEAGEILADVPIFRAASKFIARSSGQLPGGFIDPIGHLELIDIDLMTDKMRQMARKILSVDVLTFHRYVSDHLGIILINKPTREQYTHLLTSIVNHINELESEGVLEVLKNIEFIRTRDGNYALPSNCYYWTENLEKVLGKNKEYWVENAWMPSDRSVAARFKDILESKLGMPTQPSIEKIVSQIEVIATTKPIDDIATLTEPLIGHILERFAHFKKGEDERKTLEKLKELAWLPGSIDGDRVQGKRYSPKGLYRIIRANGFASQVAVVDLPALKSKKKGSSVDFFLDFLEMPETPPTKFVVAHLEHCMTNQLPAPDATYAILNERSKEANADCIDRLANQSFIYDSNIKEYLRSDQVFWNKTYFQGFWHSASTRMRSREALYRRLGVKDEPSAYDYLALMKKIVSRPTISDQAKQIHERCLAWLAEAIERGDDEVFAAISEVGDEPVLLNMLGGVAWFDEVTWLDSQILIEPFADTLEDALIAPPAVSRQSATRLFRELGVERFSQIARMQLSVEPTSRPDPNSTSLLRQRSELLLWLAPNNAFHDRLQDILHTVKVNLAEDLQVVVEITEYEPPVRSDPTPTPAFYASDTETLYVKRSPSGTINWTDAFSALFAPLEEFSHGHDIRPLILAAKSVVSVGSTAEAEQDLRASGYSRPNDVYDVLPEADTISDFDKENNEETDADSISPDGFNGKIDGDIEFNGAPQLGEKSNSAGKQKTGSSTDAGCQSNGRPANKPNAIDNITDESLPENSVRDNSSKWEAGDGSSGKSDQLRPHKNSNENNASHSGASSGDRSNNNRRTSPNRAKRQERRSRMLAYANAAPRDLGRSSDNGSRENASNSIDMAAISAALRYEENAGRVPIEQPHNNPGYDIKSSNTDGNEQRLIEVKGLKAQWNERGVKLTHVQFAMAQQNPEKFWIYVVEYACDPKLQRVSAIKNPFAKVTEYWFDHGWKNTLEDTISAFDLNLRIGSKVRHSVWGVGAILRIDREWNIVNVVVDFEGQGKKYIKFNDDLEFI